MMKLHTIMGRKVYERDGLVSVGVRTDESGREVPALVCRRNPDLELWVHERMTLCAFKHGVARGTVDLLR